MLFSGVGGNYLCLVHSVRLFPDVYEFWVRKLEFVDEYEVFVDVVVLFGWSAPFVCITSVVKISFEIRLYGPCNSARIWWSTNVFDVTKGFLYGLIADMIFVTNLNMVAII
jgi:hypothetical protein